MLPFYTVRHNSFQNHGLPWIDLIRKGLQSDGLCPKCKGTRDRPAGELQVSLEQKKAKHWPDVLGCGAYPLLILSSRVLEAWRTEAVGVFPTSRVTFYSPLPRGLEDSEPPAYYWLDGGNMLGARMDFDASGFVDVRFCLTCGRRTDNIPATYERQHSRKSPYAFVPETWTGQNLFTTDISPTAFFCTERVVECARKHQFTNFRFVPVEEDAAAGSPGVAYM